MIWITKRQKKLFDDLQQKKAKKDFCNAPINCFHQGPEGGQTPGELKKCEFILSDSPSKGEKLRSNFPPREQRIAFNFQ